MLVQIRTAPARTQSGLYLAPETRSDRQWNTQVARVVELGPLAFRNRETAERWPEGSWCSPGDFIRVPRWGGDRWEREVPGAEEKAKFVIFNDHEVIAKLTIDPLEMKEYLL